MTYASLCSRLIYVRAFFQMHEERDRKGISPISLEVQMCFERDPTPMVRIGC